MKIILHTTDGKYVVKYDASTIYPGKGQALMAKQNYPELVKR